MKELVDDNDATQTAWAKEEVISSTGTSFHTFVQDKSLEHLWDGTVMKLFASKGLEFEENS